MTYIGKLKPAPGRLLVSEPSLNDNYFSNAVVLLAEHNKDGTFGLIINKPSDIRLSEVTQEYDTFDPLLFFGGPVQVDSLYFIHRIRDIPGSLQLIDGLYWGGDVDEIKKLMKAGKLTGNDIRFFIGYAGWAPSQLDRELGENSWLVLETDIRQLFSPNSSQLWRDIVTSLGEEIAIWVNYPENPQMN